MVNFRKMYEGSWFTIIGAGGDINEWKEGLQNMLTEENIGTITEWATFKGIDYNSYYETTGDNRYPDDITFLAFSIEGLNIGRLAMFKLRMGGRWFDDVVDNDMRREGRYEYLNSEDED